VLEWRSILQLPPLQRAYALWTYLRRADHLLEVDIHPRITVEQMPVECLSILELNKLHITTWLQAIYR
jgi:hypothetical protein